MSVTTTALAIRQPWQGFMRAELPIGSWRSKLELTGDGSGGVRQLTIIFRGAVETRSALAYSMERMSCQDTDNLAKNVQGETAGFDLETQFLARVEQGVTIAALRDGTNEITRHFLGVAERAAASVVLIIQTPNVTGEVFTVEAEGYIWSQRSINAEGGYQVPVTTPWGNR